MAITEIALVGTVAALPRVAAIRELNWVGITARRSDNHHVGQLAAHAKRLRVGIDRGQLHVADFFLGSIIDDDIEFIIGTDSVFVALMLDHVLEREPVSDWNNGDLERITHTIVHQPGV